MDIDRDQLKDIGTERAVLAGLCQFGSQAYADVSDIIDIQCFTLPSNQILYKCIVKSLEQQDSIDIPSILSSAHDIGLSDVLKEKKETDYLRALFNFPLKFENLRIHAKKLTCLYIARQAQIKHLEAYESLSKLTGRETIDEILSLSENPILDFTHQLNQGKEDEPSILFEDIDNYLAFLEENPVDMVGISTGFKRLDAAIGGGLRKGRVNLIAARPGVGKSTMAKMVASHIAIKLKVPALILDTEMSKEDLIHRSLASLSKIDINTIETGRFGQNPIQKERVLRSLDNIKKSPLYYKNIAGKPFEEVLSIIRRWIVKKVKYDENGNVNNCALIYDYFKLMSDENISHNMQEYQLLGFQISKLTDFCQQYSIACLAFTQLNRDGISRENLGILSSSDRLSWLSGSVAILKPKSDEEMLEDGPEFGNLKLLLLKHRDGPGLSEGDYININMQGNISLMSEGKTKNETKITQVESKNVIY